MILSKKKALEGFLYSDRAVLLVLDVFRYAEHLLRCTQAPIRPVGRDKRNLFLTFLGVWPLWAQFFEFWRSVTLQRSTKYVSSDSFKPQVRRIKTEGVAEVQSQPMISRIETSYSKFSTTILLIFYSWDP
jgi:hypothetical protein